MTVFAPDRLIGPSNFKNDSRLPSLSVAGLSLKSCKNHIIKMPLRNPLQRLVRLQMPLPATAAETSSIPRTGGAVLPPPTSAATAPANRCSTSANPQSSTPASAAPRGQKPTSHTAEVHKAGIPPAPSPPPPPTQCRPRHRTPRPSPISVIPHVILACRFDHPHPNSCQSQFPPCFHVGNGRLFSAAAFRPVAPAESWRSRRSSARRAPSLLKRRYSLSGRRT